MKQASFIEKALRYHKIVLLIVVVLVGTGIYGLATMPKQEMPPMTIRQGAVVAVYPGATSTEVEERVAKPLESFVNEHPEVNKAKTYSVSRDGMAIVFVELNDNIDDKDAFWSKVKHGLSTLRPQLPAGIVALQAQDDIGDTSSMLITLESDDKTYRELERYLEGLEDRLRKVESVSRLRRFGLQREQISVYLDQNKLSQYGIGPYTLLTGLFAQGFTTLSGSVDDGSLDAPLHVAESIDGEREVARQIVWSSPDGRVVRLEDVARIEREYPDPDKYIRNNGKKCVLLSVEMRQGCDVVALGGEVRDILRQYERELPESVRIYAITDQSKVVQDSVRDFLRELLTAVVAVIVVVILLMPLRVAGVAALSIPITIFTALACFWAFDIELNTVTLAALIVTLGMVVDDSVVIIDNYIEKLGEGMPRRTAAVAAPKEFFTSVLSATLSISVTFFPLLFTMHGIYHDFIRFFPWAMFIILSISLAVSLLLTPYLQYFFIRKGLTAERKSGERKRPLDRLQAGYDRLLACCFAHPWLTMGAGLASVVAGAAMLTSNPQRLMPIAERNQFAVEIYLPSGAAAAQTAQTAASVERVLRSDPLVASVTTFIGQGSPRFHSSYAPQAGGSNFAQFIVNTKGAKETEKLLDRYADSLAEAYPEAYVRFKQMDYSDATYPVEIRLSGDSLSDLRRGAEVVARCLRAHPGTKLVRTNYEEPRPGIAVVPDERELSRLGLNRAVLSADLALHFGKGIPAATLWEDDYPLSVVLKSEREGKPSATDVPDEYVPALNGLKSVPLRQVADVRPDWTPGAIVRRNGVRTVSVTAEARRGVNVEQLTREVAASLPADSLPAGVSWEVGGMTEEDAETLPMITRAVGLAVVIIFFILLFHFKKITLAAINLGSVGLCVLGAATGLRALGLDMSITAILGIVSLMGILVRNGIILLDYAEELRLGEGMSAKEAALHAGRRRLRPIFLTSAAASVGVLPMVLENSALWTPMGTVILFGTLISMVLISTLLPVAYWLAFRGSERIRRAVFHGRKENERPDESVLLGSR